MRHCTYVDLSVGCVAQCIGRRSLARELSLIYTPDLWLTYDHFVDRVSAVGQPTRPTQTSISQGAVNM